MTDAKSLGYIQDTFSNDSRTATLVAHDTVEHAINHRTKAYVTYEDEIRAVAGIGFMRSDLFDPWEEMVSQVTSHRPIKPVPYIVGVGLLKNDDVSADLMRLLISKGVEPACARNAAYQYAWGYAQKYYQFGGDANHARCAFNFIESNVDIVFNEIVDRRSWGASIYFDSVKHIFRYQMKWDN